MWTEIERNFLDDLLTFLHTRREINLDYSQDKNNYFS